MRTNVEGNVQLKVQWKNSKPTWEPLQNMKEDLEDEVREFMEEQHNKRQHQQKTIVPDLCVLCNKEGGEDGHVQCDKCQKKTHGKCSMRMVEGSRCFTCLDENQQKTFLQTYICDGNHETVTQFNICLASYNLHGLTCFSDNCETKWCSDTPHNLDVHPVWECEGNKMACSVAFCNVCFLKKIYG